MMPARVATGQAASSLLVRPKQASRSCVRPGLRRPVVVVRAGANDASAGLSTRLPARVITGVAWASLVGYAVGFAPKGSEALDMELVSSLIASPYSGEVNYLFESIFNSFAIIPAVYAALLMPGAKDQKPVPAQPFVVGSWALGYFVLGPYLALREIREEPVERSSLGFLTRNVLEAKWNAALLLAFATFLAYSAASHFSPEVLADYRNLLSTQALVSVSSADLATLSLMVYFPMVEDMRRRGWEDKTALAAAFTAVPVVGPSLYLLVRPSLEE
eukprot:CAMPEP_0118928444 /NCGR_PEP_ID=MMETSP1169-20130426/5696_1 /TAXON_ID=36882 /ORGANISM="Pyramimonas obovata, Strain CCMP722" /LENGTH=273 /DNA_ID=CAMNT_0006870419 /DNA_START=24 /DNA_END=845 /DNA_ORIENTATION=-